MMWASGLHDMRAKGGFLLICLCLAAQFSVAQQQEEEEVTPVIEQEQPVVEAEVEQIPSPIAESSGGFEDFDPSEDISEDLSVPFPIDI